jgi:hypothetical protein
MRRCIAADRKLTDDLNPITEQDEPILGNLGVLHPNQFIPFLTSHLLYPMAPKYSSNFDPMFTAFATQDEPSQKGLVRFDCR